MSVFEISVKVDGIEIAYTRTTGEKVAAQAMRSVADDLDPPRPVTRPRGGGIESIADIFKPLESAPGPMLKEGGGA